MRRQCLFLILTFLLLNHGVAQALTVEEAYRLIPHQRTIFETHSSKLSPDTASTLIEVFQYVDQIIVLKETILTNRFAGNADLVKKQYSQISDQIAARLSATELASFRDSLLGGIRDQAEYLGLAKSGSISLDIDNRHLKVRASSAQLVQAYNILMQKFPHEVPHNKQAFYDYLCALDMI